MGRCDSRRITDGGELQSSSLCAANGGELHKLRRDFRYVSFPQNPTLQRDAAATARSRISLRRGSRCGFQVTGDGDGDRER